MSRWIPEGWREATLGALVIEPHGLQTGPFGSQLQASEYTADGVPVIMARDLIDGEVATDHLARVPPAKAATLSRYWVRTGDVLVARRGELGRSTAVGPAEDGWLCGTGCLRARPCPGVEPRYLAHFLRWEPTVTWLEENAVGQTMRNLNTRILSRLPVRLPPPIEQRRIAATLDAAGDAIRAARAVLDQLARVREAMVRELLRRGVTTQERATRPSAVGDIPEGWSVKSLGELSVFSNGHRFLAAEWSDAGLPIIRIQNLNGGRDFRYFAGYAKKPWLVEPGELLFAWAGLKGVSFGPCIWSGPRGVLNQHIFRIRPRPEVSKLWLYESLRQVTRQIEDKARGFKETLMHVRKSDVTGQLVAVPPSAEQEAIAERSRELTALAEREQAALDRALTLERSLRHDLFTGRRPSHAAATLC